MAETWTEFQTRVTKEGRWPEFQNRKAELRKHFRGDPDGKRKALEQVKAEFAPVEEKHALRLAPCASPVASNPPPGCADLSGLAEAVKDRQVDPVEAIQWVMRNMQRDPSTISADEVPDGQAVTLLAISRTPGGPTAILTTWQKLLNNRSLIEAVQLREQELNLPQAMADFGRFLNEDD